MATSDEQRAREVEESGNAAEIALAAAVLALLATENDPSEDRLAFAVLPSLRPFALAFLALLQRDAATSDLRDWSAAVDEAVQDAAQRLHLMLQEVRAEIEADPETRGGAMTDRERAKIRSAVDTTITWLTGHLGDTSAQLMGYTSKRWFTRLDSRVRGSHRAIEGQTVPVGSTFRSGLGAQLRYPGDRAAPIQETANCRCRIVYTNPRAA